jgi:hypothetical protein
MHHSRGKGWPQQKFIMYALLLLLLHNHQQATFGICNAKDALSGVLYIGNTCITLQRMIARASLCDVNRARASKSVTGM